MRYYVLYEPDTTSVRPYIVAEVVREPSDDGRFRDVSPAASLAGDRCLIMTRDELVAHTGGARALLAWEDADDLEFDTDTNMLSDRVEESEASASRGHLRLVEEEREPAAFEMAPGPREPWMVVRRRRLMSDAVRLAARARIIIDQIHARRQNRADLQGTQEGKN